MLDSRNAFVTPAYLRSVWDEQFNAFKDTPAEAELLDRLQRWATRPPQIPETVAEPAFIEEFFHQTWGYIQAGQSGAADGYTLHPQFKVPGAGAAGGTGRADLALGFFTGTAGIPQVLCEYKSIHLALDADQKRKSNTRSPVRQALDYLSHARKGMIGSEPQVPTWAVVSDMNEFRLYWYDRGDRQHVGFVIRPRDLLDGPGLLASTEAGRFDRFLFARLFHRDTLLSRGGPSALLTLINDRRFRDRQIEDAFYAEYRALRDDLYTDLLARNNEGTPRFPGTRGRLVRLAQKILDRLLFVFFCEDMGQQLAFPPKLLQDFLVGCANDRFFEPNSTTVWQGMLGLFRAIDAGTAFGGKAIHRFNGGLFAPDPALEALHISNTVFCQPLQGQNEASIAGHPRTVLYLCATYNYAADLGEGGARDDRRSLGLYTLGRIFEQSITELEILEAEADGRPSVNKASQRKRDGVYYTPEWVVERVVDGTLGPAFRDMRRASGWPKEGVGLPTMAAVDGYLGRLRQFAVLDPACGSGAFLITALRCLVAEWSLARRMRAEVSSPGDIFTPETEAALVARLLRDNIFGVDINPASVELAQLALWLHTARGDQALSSLDRTVVVGNTLVTPDFFNNVQLGLYDTEAQERVAAFDWQAAFPAVAARGGFDAVVGNPPYVKLQNFRPAYPGVADYLVRGRPGGRPPFESTRTGNFDLYLPFIEQGLAMLNPAGRLGYIAPSLWTVNEYGAGLRALVARGRQLDRWLDFKSHQVFAEATTYTALQFFSKAPTEAICVAQAPQGVAPPDPWDDAGQRLAWGSEGFGDRWLLLTGEERALVDRLNTECPRLDDPSCTHAIFVGLQTSADSIYHLKRLAPGRYASEPASAPSYSVEIEDAIMRPLVSGAEAKRYQEPRTDIWLLFPYATTGGQVRLIPSDVMAQDYPKAWAYLQSYAPALRCRELKRDGGREHRPFDDQAWYRFGRHQGLDKQDLPKLIVAQTVPSLRVFFDSTGQFAPNNVRVNGIISADEADPWYLLGILNAPVADWVFKRIAKPKDGGWFEANKQFIAPLPIPPATDGQRADVASRARELQRLHTQRRDLLARVARRLGAVRSRIWPETWLFAGLVSAPDREAGAPASLDASARRAWARAAYAAELAARHNTLTAALNPGMILHAELVDGELRLLADGAPVLDRIFVTEADGAFVLAQWKVLASTFAVTERTGGSKLSKALRTLAQPDNAAVVEQVLAAVGELGECAAAIHAAESELNEIVFILYGLTPVERALMTGASRISASNGTSVATAST